MNNLNYEGIKIQNIYEKFDEFKTKEKQSFTNCILANENYLPWDMFNLVKDLLSPHCANFVVYSKYWEPLHELEKYLNES